MNKWSIAAILAVTALGGYMALKTPRGIRNHNPGNIRQGANWNGMRPKQTDEEFVQFEAPEWGIRAMTRVLKNYQQHHGLRTIKEIINRWAPTKENNTSAYVASVSEYSGIEADQDINVMEVMPQLIAAITYHENGQQPYPHEVIMQGIMMEAQA